MRELLRVASRRVDIRRFLGFGFSERLPVHQTISHAQTRRFVDARLFERLFLRSVALCKEHGLIDGTHLSVDGFHVEADAALASLRASLARVDDDGDVPAGTSGAGAEAPAASGDGGAGGAGGEGGVSAETSRPQLSLVEPRSGPTPKRRSSNATSSSCTDPDAKLRGKPGQRPHLVHRAQIAVDPKARCVVACLGETADGHEGEALAARARCKTPTGIWAHMRRMCDAEGGVAELKNEHGMDSARCRGTGLFQVQLLLGCAALNVKRLAGRTGAATGQAAGPAEAQQAAEEGASAGSGAASAARRYLTSDLTARSPIAPAARTAWTITLSMN